MEALQSGIYARLAGVLPCPIHDGVPDDVTFPFVTLGEDTEEPVHTKGTGIRVSENTHTLHVFSRYRGMQELTRILDTITQAFDTPIDMSGFGFAEVELIPEHREVFREDDGITRHGIVRIRATIQDIS
jgi:hypothetical protein